MIETILDIKKEIMNKEDNESIILSDKNNKRFSTTVKEIKQIINGLPDATLVSFSANAEGEQSISFESINIFQMLKLILFLEIQNIFKK